MYIYTYIHYNILAIFSGVQASHQFSSSLNWAGKPHPPLAGRRNCAPDRVATQLLLWGFGSQCLPHFGRLRPGKAE